MTVRRAGGTPWRAGGTPRRRGGSVVPALAEPAALAVAAVLVLGGCGSGSGHSRVSATVHPTSVSRPARSSTSAVPPTVAGQLPTVFDCGGGAYEPATLLVVCGDGSTTATQVRWSSWTATAARGTGTVNLPGHAPVPAVLTLGRVVPTGSGPEFSQLEVRWTGPSPDGQPSRAFELSTAPGGS